MEDKKNEMGTEALIAKMRAGIRETYEIRLRELVIPVRVLSVDEVNAIRREAEQHRAASSGDETDKNLHIQKTTLSLASNLNGIPLLSDRFYAVSKITVDEVNYLYNEYIRVLDAVNPSLERIGQEQFRAIVEALKKNTVSVSDLSISQLRAICSSYVELIREQDTQI